MLPRRYSSSRLRYLGLECTWISLRHPSCLRTKFLGWSPYSSIQFVNGWKTNGIGEPTSVGGVHRHNELETFQYQPSSGTETRDHHSTEDQYLIISITNFQERSSTEYLCKKHRLPHIEVKNGFFIHSQIQHTGTFKLR